MGESSSSDHCRHLGMVLPGHWERVQNTTLWERELGTYTLTPSHQLGTDSGDIISCSLGRPCKQAERCQCRASPLMNRALEVQASATLRDHKITITNQQKGSEH